MAALLMVMGVTLSSCLDSGEPDNTRIGLFRVKNGYMGTGYFQDIAGNKLTPTYASLLKVEEGNFKMSSTNLAYITYEVVEAASSKASGADTPQSYDIVLKSAMAMDGAAVVIADNVEDMNSQAVSTAPVVSISHSETFFSPFLYDKETLFLPIVYSMENNEKALAQHKLILSCNVEEFTSENSDMVFYLHHDKGTDDKTAIRNILYSGYDIKDAVDAYINATGNEPKKVIVKVKETGEYSSSNTMPEEYTTYSCEFKVNAPLTRNN